MLPQLYRDPIKFALFWNSLLIIGKTSILSSKFSNAHRVSQISSNCGNEIWLKFGLLFVWLHQSWIPIFIEIDMTIFEKSRSKIFQHGRKIGKFPNFEPKSGAPNNFFSLVPIWTKFDGRVYLTLFGFHPKCYWKKNN